MSITKEDEKENKSAWDKFVEKESGKNKGGKVKVSKKTLRNRRRRENGIHALKLWMTTPI